MTDQERLNQQATENALRVGRQMMAMVDAIFAPRPAPTVQETLRSPSSEVRPECTRS